MKQLLTIAFIAISLGAFCQIVNDKDTLTMEMTCRKDRSLFFYKTKSFAFSLSLDEIRAQQIVFKRKFRVEIKQNTFSEDTIWLNPFIRQKWEPEIKLLCWNKIKTQTACVINTNSNEIISQVYSFTWSDYYYNYYQYVDCKTGTVIFESRDAWIGCPPF